MNWKYFVRMALPGIRIAAEMFKKEDANNTGRDDMIGIGFAFAADFIEAAINDEDLPVPPAALSA